MPAKKTEKKKTEEKPSKSIKKEIKKREVKPSAKTSDKTSIKESNDKFLFGGNNGTDIPKRMSKEERDAIIGAALTPKRGNKDISELEYTVEETEYVPDKWVVVLTPDGFIYKEPVPRYWNYNTFTSILASIPDKPIDSYNRINFSSEICKTSFNVKNIECYIISVPFEGNRRKNTYSDVFKIKNSTKYVGGNIVFAGGDDGLDSKQATEVVKEIVKILKEYEEVIDYDKD